MTVWVVNLLQSRSCCREDKSMGMDDHNAEFDFFFSLRRAKYDLMQYPMSASITDMMKTNAGTCGCHHEVMV